MTKEEAVAELDGCEYRKEGSPALFRRMKEAGLVAVFGASDDLMEFRGAIDDEAGLGPTYVGPEGIMHSECEEGQGCPYFRRTLEHAPSITPHFDPGNGLTFRYATEHIPGVVTFRVFETDDGVRSPYCEGIVFRLSHVGTMEEGS